jgi:PAS domain S-box-containing protein
MACLGNTADITTLSRIRAASTEEIYASLWDALRLELVVRSDDSYRFVHDRVQEAAYSLIPTELRADAHLRLGRLMATRIPREEQEEAIFEIVNQYNRGAALVESQLEREQLAELNLLAGQRARASTAYASGLKYLTIGADLLADNAWSQRHELRFPLELHRAECEFLLGDPKTASERLAVLATRAADLVELATVTCLRVDVHTTLDRSDLAIEVCLDYLRHLGIEWSPHPTFDEARREYDRIWAQLGTRDIAQLIDMPPMTDRSSLATLDVLTKAMPPALFTDENLSALVICGAVNLSLKHGNSDGSCGAYVWFGVISGPRFGNYKAGFEFGQLGYQLVEQCGLKRFQAPVYMLFGNLVMPWTKHIRQGEELVRRAFDAAVKLGDLTFAGYSCNNLITNLLASGDALPDVQHEAEIGLAFAQRAQFGLIIDIINSQLGLIRTLRGLKPTFGSFDDEEFSEIQFERHLGSQPALAIAECWYWVRKLQARFFAADYPAALDALRNAKRLLWTSPSLFEGAEAHFYGALTHAACCDPLAPEKTREHFDALLQAQRLIATWAENCPANFENRAALIAAEVARIEGRPLDAERHYEEAISSAHEHGFIQNEALANELAGRFYATRGMAKVATTYLREARYCYVRWGADGKAQQLDELHPHLRADKQFSDSTATILTPVEHLDLATVIKISEAVSGEIVLEKLINTLMRTALEHAGATRGLLILQRGGECRVEAEATVDSSVVNVDLRQTSISDAEFPESILRYVIRTKESVLLHDAAGESSFSDDEYVRERRARSVLCIPILKQTQLLGALYLENDLTAHAFTPARMAVLKLLASGAAISIENARLYRDLGEREARIRRLVDANIIGIFIWDLEGRILEANDAFLRMVGYDRQDLASRPVRWTEMTPPEWRERDEQLWLPAVIETGTLQPFEKEFFRKDGTRVPVLLGAATFQDDEHQGVAFVIDLTERKLTADTLRALQTDLAHANRLATMGQLVASIAHEVNQPIGGARNNAHAGLRFLAKEPPELEEVREALEAVVNETYRAGDIVKGIRDQVKKLPPRMERVDLNDAIGQVIALVRGELLKQRVAIQTRLADPLPPAHADRVQLQQVMLNLIINAIEAIASADDEVRELVIGTESSSTGDLLVAVADSGPGIALKDRDRIFESFYTTKAGGVGIGLSICRSIVDAHGGKLWVDANQPRGAVFRFTLPASN